MLPSSEASDTWLRPKDPCDVSRAGPGRLLTESDVPCRVGVVGESGAELSNGVRGALGEDEPQGEGSIRSLSFCATE